MHLLIAPIVDAVVVIIVYYGMIIRCCYCCKPESLNPKSCRHILNGLHSGRVDLHVQQFLDGLGGKGLATSKKKGQ